MPCHAMQSLNILSVLKLSRISERILCNSSKQLRYPLEYIPNAKLPAVGGHPKNIIMCLAFMSHTSKPLESVGTTGNCQCMQAFEGRPSYCKSPTTEHTGLLSIRIKADYTKQFHRFHNGGNMRQPKSSCNCNISNY